MIKELSYATYFMAKHIMQLFFFFSIFRLFWITVFFPPWFGYKVQSLNFLSPKLKGDKQFKKTYTWPPPPLFLKAVNKLFILSKPDRIMNNDMKKHH